MAKQLIQNFNVLRSINNFDQVKPETMAPPAIVSKEIPDIEVSEQKCYVSENSKFINRYEYLRYAIFGYQHQHKWQTIWVIVFLA